MIFPALWQHFAEPQHWRLFDDVQPTIEGLLERDYRLGIASNFDQRLLSICRGHEGLAALDPIFISSQVGWSKPSPQFYRQIETITGLAPEQIMFVGDDWENDVNAPRNLGWQTRWLIRRETVPGVDQVGKLTDLLTELSEVRRGGVSGQTDPS